MTDYVVDFNLDDEDLNADFELEEGEVFNAILQLDVVGSLWGNISGDINNQTDLIELLDLKADKTEVESVTGALADSIQAVDNKYDSITSGLDDSITAIDNKYDSITGALDDKIDSINSALSDDIDALESITSGLSDSISAETTNRQNADSIIGDSITALDNKFDSITGALSDSITGIDSIISNYGDIVTYDAAYFATSIQGALADTALQPNDNISELNNDAGYITSASLPTVNNSSVVFQKNGTDFDTITLNQSNNDTINISVPTDTNDLTNGAGFLANNATGTKALAVGNTSQSTAEGGVAVGYGARANSTYATAVGEEARANNTNTTVIGKAAKATEARAIAIGSGAEANAQDAIAIKGINNTANTFQVYTYNMLDMSTGLIPDARISTNIARTSDMQTADNSLQSQIDAIVASSDVFDIVGTYAELQAYDISTVPVNDIIKVLVDSTHNNAATYYRCTETGGVKSWTYIGAEGAYYTKSESDNRFVPLTRTVNGIALSSDITLTASDVNALPDTTVIPTVNNSSIDFQINGTSFDTITLNQSSNDTINISVPTDTNDLTNGAGYITAASLPTDYYTKSEIDAIIPQPTKVPIVYYQPTDSYCYTESNNRFYGSHVFEKLYLVQPKTSGTTQVIDMSTTFSLSFTIDYKKAPSSAVTVAEIMTSYSAGKGVLLQLNSTGLYYRNNITGTTITGTRALTAGNSYDIKAEYDGTHMIISYKLSSDANYTQINSTTCTCDGSNYNYAAIGMNTDNGNLSLSSVVLVNGADTLYSYMAGKIALDYDGSTLKLNASNQLSVDFTGYATETWVNNQGFITSAALANYLQKDVAQSTTGTITFIGQKKIEFKQSAAADKLGFTCFNASNTEIGAFEYRPNTIGSGALFNINVPYSSTSYVGFRYWGTAVNVVAPKVATAGTYYIPTHITDGNITVTANNQGVVDISSLISGGSGTVDQVYDPTSINAQAGVAIAGAHFIPNLSYSTNGLAINVPDGNISTYTSASNNSIAIGGMQGTNLECVASGTRCIQLGYGTNNESYTLKVGSSADYNWKLLDMTTGLIPDARLNSALIKNESYNAGGIAIAIPNGNQTSASSTSIAIGGTSSSISNSECVASGDRCIQLGYGTNSTNYTLKVGSSSDYNWTLLDMTNGLIPDARLSSNIARTSQIPSITIDQTYDGTSANPQSGVAISGELTNYIDKTTNQSITSNKTFTNNSVLYFQNGAIIECSSGCGVHDITDFWLRGQNTYYGYPRSIVNNNNGIVITKQGLTQKTDFTIDGNKIYDADTGLVPDARISSNIARTSQIPSISNLADKDLSNLSATGKTVIDGQWIRAANEISTSKTVGTTSLKSNINAIIPNDGYVYELILDIVALGNGNNSCELAIQSTLCYSPWVVWISNGSTACARLVVPVASDRELNKIITSNAFNACSVYLSAYRRIGSNS